MAVHDDMRAAIIIVSGDWAKYLATIRTEDHEEIIGKMIESYKDIFNKLADIHGFSMKLKS